MPEQRLEWIVDECRFAAVEAAWDALAADQPTPFSRHAWVAHWWRAFAADAPLRICLLWEDEGLVGAIPLMASRAPQRISLSVLTGWWLSVVDHNGHHGKAVEQGAGDVSAARARRLAGALRRSVRQAGASPPALSLHAAKWRAAAPLH